MGKIKKLFGFRVVLLLVILFFAIISINYNPYASGIQIKSVSGIAAEQGLKAGQIIYGFNDNEINTVEDFKNALDKSFISKEVKIDIETDKGSYSYTAKDSLGFEAFNLTITDVDIDVPLEQGMKIIKINSVLVEDNDKYYEIINNLLPKTKYKISTDAGEFAFLSYKKPDINVKVAATSNIKKGLDLEGGTRVLLEPKSEGDVTDKNINDLISVLSERLNVYGLSDLKVRSAKDWEGNKFVLVEIAGATKDEVIDLIAQQGVFEAKIGKDVVFSGGEKDIPFVCKDDGTCSGVRDCVDVGQNQASCRFEFVIHLSPEASKRHAEVTKDLEITFLEGSKKGYLSEKIDFYLDGKLVDSLNIGADLKGKEASQIMISGPGYGINKAEAYNNAVSGMERLQTILIAGSLPLKLEIVKLDTISPVLGKNFINNAFLVGILAIISVALVVFVRYRKIKIVIPMILTGLSEVVLILGFASFIGWNLDLVSIAGIIAAVGTGVDDQIVVIDETLKSRESYLNWKQKLKRAFFIIMAAYATTVAAMIPLWNAGAGLIRGFAITTIIGVTIGVFLTRPAFAHLVRVLLEE